MPYSDMSELSKLFVLHYTLTWKERIFERRRVESATNKQIHGK